MSNFSPKQLKIRTEIGFAPTVNQLSFSTGNHSKLMINYDVKLNVCTQWGSPLSYALPRYESTMSNAGKNMQWEWSAVYMELDSTKW